MYKTLNGLHFQKGAHETRHIKNGGDKSSVSQAYARLKVLDAIKENFIVCTVLKMYMWQYYYKTHRRGVIMFLGTQLNTHCHASACQHSS